MSIFSNPLAAFATVYLLNPYMLALYAIGVGVYFFFPEKKA